MENKPLTIKIPVLALNLFLCIGLLVAFNVILVLGGFQATWSVENVSVQGDEPRVATIRRTPGWAIFWESIEDSRWHSPWESSEGGAIWYSDSPNNLTSEEVDALVESRFDVVSLDIIEARDLTDSLEWGTLVKAQIRYETGETKTRQYQWSEGRHWFNAETKRPITHKETMLLDSAFRLENNTVVEVEVREGENWKWTYYRCIIEYKGGHQLTREYLYKQDSDAWYRYPTMTPIIEEIVKWEGVFQAYDRKCATDIFDESQPTTVKEVE